MEREENLPQRGVDNKTDFSVAVGVTRRFESQYEDDWTSVAMKETRKVLRHLRGGIKNGR